MSFTLQYTDTINIHNNIKILRQATPSNSCLLLNTFVLQWSGYYFYYYYTLEYSLDLDYNPVLLPPLDNAMPWM